MGGWLERLSVCSNVLKGTVDCYTDIDCMLNKVVLTIVAGIASLEVECFPKSSFDKVISVQSLQ